MVGINGISRLNGQNIYFSSKIDNPNKSNFNLRQNYYGDARPQESIGLGEGLGLIAKGFGQGIKNTVGAVINHPIKTLGVVGLTTAGLAALPLVGIPIAAGGAALALGFAGLAAVNGIKHVSQFVKNNSNGEYDKARGNLKEIGADGVDLALSAPFVPKGIKEVKNLAKYGKIGLNTQAISELKSVKSAKDVLNVIKGANNEAGRAMNFNKATEVELSKLQGVTDLEKAGIKDYIKDYNVPKDRIPDVVLDQWAKEHGISTKPTLKRIAIENKNTVGYASPSRCEIGINDPRGQKIKLNSNCKSERFQQIGNTRINKNNYEFTYKDNVTGEVFVHRADKAVVDARQKLIKHYKDLSKEANEVLTITHEREHIDQFAKMFAIGEKPRMTAQAHKMYTKMVAEMKPLTTEQMFEYKKMAIYNPKRRTLAAYTMDPSEIGARTAEINLARQTKFKTLDKVFKGTNNAKIPQAGKDVFVWNAIRSQSAAS